MGFTGCSLSRYSIDSFIGLNTLEPMKMTDILQTTFSNSFPWIKIKCHWSFFFRGIDNKSAWLGAKPRSWWCHQIETLSALLALCAGNSHVTGKFPHKGQWRGVLMFSLFCAWTNFWINNRDAVDLRRHRVHYDVTVMRQAIIWTNDDVAY